MMLAKKSYDPKLYYSDLINKGCEIPFWECGNKFKPRNILNQIQCVAWVWLGYGEATPTKRLALK